MTVLPGAGTGSSNGRNGGTAVLIHVGYPKTATTWAQNRLFTSQACGFWNPFPHNRDLRELNKVIIGAGAFDFDPASARSFFEARFATRKSRDGLVPVVSAESLVGHHYSPSQFDARIIAERLRAVFPEARTRVLIVIREQKTMILSRYAQFVRGGGWKSVERFVDAFDADTFPRWGHINRSYLLYDRLIAHYQGLFGKGRVCVLPFELLLRDPADFVRQIVAFAGARISGELPDFENTKSRISAASIRLRRWLNPFITVDRGNPFGVLMPEAIYFRYARFLRRLDTPVFSKFAGRSERLLKKRIAALTAGYYGDSNRRTSALTGIDLSKLGYDCGDSGENRQDICPDVAGDMKPPSAMQLVRRESAELGST